MWQNLGFLNIDPDRITSIMSGNSTLIRTSFEMFLQPNMLHVACCCMLHAIRSRVGRHPRRGGAAKEKGPIEKIWPNMALECP